MKSYASWLTVGGYPLVLAALVLASGCSSNGSSGGSSSTVAPATSGTAGTGSSTTPGVTPTNQPPVGRWWRGDLHSHSAPYSQDADRQFGDAPGVGFFLAEQAGLDYLALTDHRTLDQVNDPTYHAQTLTILDGTEWGGTTHHGFIGLRQAVPELDRTQPASTLNAQMQAAYDDVHRQGGIVIANHPADPSKAHVWLSHDFEAIEIWNIYWSLPEFGDGDGQDVDDKLVSLGLTAIGEDANPEIREAMRHKGGGMNYQALKFWEANLNRGRHIAAVGGGDRHSITFPGLPTTRIFAEDKTREKLLEGIRKGRTWVGSYDGPEVEFTADADGDGVFESILGDSVPLNRAVTYKVNVKNAKGGKLELIKNGQVLQVYALLSDDDTFTFSDTSTTRSWIRVDVFEPVNFNVANSGGFQLLATTGAPAGTGLSFLSTFGQQLGFQVSVGTRAPTIRLPHEYDVILNFDRTHWGYGRGAVTSPIWAE